MNNDTDSMDKAAFGLASLHVLTNAVNVCYMYVFIPSGAIYEKKSISGISHFLEHLLFKNKGITTNISRTLTSIGGRYNASTSKDVTCFFIEAPVRHYKMIIDMMHQITQRLNFDNREFATEKKVVLEEYAQSAEHQDFSFWNVANGSVLDDSNVYMNSIIGTYRSINGLKYDMVKQYAKERYKQYTIVLNCDKRYLQRSVMYLSSVFKLNDAKQNETSLIRYLINEEPIFRSAIKIYPKLVFLRKSTPQFNTSLTFATRFHGGCKDNITVTFLQFILTSSGINSVLNNIVRVKRGLVYTMMSLYDVTRYNGMFYVHFSSSSPKTDYIINLVLRTLYELKSRGLSYNKLKYFQKSFIDNIRVKMSNESYRTSELGTYAFYGLLLDTDDIINHMNKITNDDIIRVAKQTFDFKKMGIVSFGRYSNVDRISKVIEDNIITYQTLIERKNNIYSSS